MKRCVNYGFSINLSSLLSYCMEILFLAVCSPCVRLFVLRLQILLLTSLKWLSFTLSCFENVAYLICFICMIALTLVCG